MKKVNKFTKRHLIRKMLALFLSLVLMTGISINSVLLPVKAADLTSRKLSDQQLTAMMHDPATKLRTEISTVADAVAYLNMRFPNLWMSYHLWQGANSSAAILRSGDEVLDGTVQADAGNDNAGRSDIATAVAYLLSDNMTIGSIYGFWHFSDGTFGPIKEVNYIYENGQYTIFDPVIGMKGDSGSRQGPLLPSATVSSLDDYAKLISSDDSLNSVIDSLYAIDNGQQLTFTYKADWTTVSKPSVQPFYSNKSISENQYGNIIPENITKYTLPTILGGLTMSIDDAKALVGQSPQVIKDKVKTAGDLLLYMLAAKMLLKNGDEQIEADGHTWHYNDTADVTLSQNLGNCGRMANLANYLLQGDYDEIGFILHSYYPQDGGGGHVYNYIKYQGKYYIVDFSSYLFNNYDPSSEFKFIALDKLSDYATRYTECYGGRLATIIAHTSTGTHLPNVWENGYCYFPENAQFTTILQTPGTGYAVGTLPCLNQVPDWRIPQCSTSTSSSNVGVSYTTYVQNTGWTMSSINGNISGTQNKSLRTEGLTAQLINAPVGAHIIYQAYCQHYAWTKAAQDGNKAGAAGHSLRMEGLRMTLSGMDGYEIEYRAYCQSYGWMPWQVVQNGKDIIKAGYAGTQGQSKRVEAIEVNIIKVS